jgi:hypothetical protein
VSSGEGSRNDDEPSSVMMTAEVVEVGMTIMGDEIGGVEEDM